MQALDHITVIAPTLGEGVMHVRDCLNLDIPFGARHTYMGTHNHRLQLGNRVYLEIVALDPNGKKPEEWRELSKNAIYKTSKITKDVIRAWFWAERQFAMMGRLFKLLLFLLVLGAVSLVGYAYLGDLSPDKSEMRESVTLDVD